ncbi:MAG: carboxymuconolactone decarboxylase family protein [Bacteroides sp.]|jgi:AhpD family alkylhydroperoxidase|nr:carboxymuconolactone decarboxylase family protein [Bacteroides sp.]
MIGKIQIPEAIGSRAEYKRKFSPGEMYWGFVQIPGAITNMAGNKRKKLADQGLIERVQLAVTEVNGCAACSYAHTYMALKQGIPQEEIKSFLSGDDAFVKQEEAKAILFAQHFADTKGLPNAEAYNTLVDEYGEAKAQIIYSAAQIMQAGNIYGIPFSALVSRLKGKPYKESSLGYELGMHIAGFVLLPFALIHGTVRRVFGVSNIRLENI